MCVIEFENDLHVREYPHHAARGDLEEGGTEDALPLRVHMPCVLYQENSVSHT